MLRVIFVDLSIKGKVCLKFTYLMMPVQQSLNTYKLGSQGVYYAYIYYVYITKQHALMLDDKLYVWLCSLIALWSFCIHLQLLKMPLMFLWQLLWLYRGDLGHLDIGIYEGVELCPSKQIYNSVLVTQSILSCRFRCITNCFTSSCVYYTKKSSWEGWQLQVLISPLQFIIL